VGARHMTPAGGLKLARPSTVPFNERPTCTIAEACMAAGLGTTKFYELMGQGAIETVRVGRRRLVKVPSLLLFLKDGTS
jgi:excisionase family DNA binding protein